jgi:ribosomal silencing factor RsfS
LDNAVWVLLDFNDVLDSYISDPSTENTTNLEELWGDAQINRIEESFI